MYCTVSLPYDLCVCAFVENTRHNLHFVYPAFFGADKEIIPAVHTREQPSAASGLNDTQIHAH